jgi:hypothetical protein
MRKFAAFLAVFAAAALSSQPAFAGGRYGGYRHGGHGHSHYGLGLGFYFGAPYYPRYYAPYYYPSYYSPYYYPQYVAPPVTYIERPSSAPQAAPAAPAGPDYWFFCRETGAYYPYVGQCAGGWERVPAQPQD